MNVALHSALSEDYQHGHNGTRQSPSSSYRHASLAAASGTSAAAAARLEELALLAPTCTLPSCDKQGYDLKQCVGCVQGLGFRV